MSNVIKDKCDKCNKENSARFVVSGSIPNGGRFCAMCCAHVCLMNSDFVGYERFLALALNA